MAAKLLVIAATRMELAFHPDFPSASAPDALLPFASWVTDTTDFVECGPGPALAGAGLAWALGRKAFASVLGMGIAGAFPGCDVEIGQAVWVGSESFGDLGAWDGDAWIDFPTLSLPGLPPQNHLDLQVPAGARAVHGVTVSAVTGSVKMANLLRDRTGAEIESMEGAAWAIVCQRCGIPLRQARGISNWVGPRDRSLWKIPEALRSLRTLLLQYSPCS